MKITEKEKKRKSLGNKLFSILKNFEYKDNSNKIITKENIPILPFNKSLEDNEFLELVCKAKDYAIKNNTRDEIIQLEEKFLKEKKYKIIIL